MTIQPERRRRFAETRHEKALNQAQVLLWVAGLFMLAVNGFEWMTLQATFDRELEKTLAARGTSIAEVRESPEAERREFEAAYAEGIAGVRLALAAGAGLGLAFIGCALSVRRRPLAATVTALALFVAVHAAFAFMDPLNLVRGLILKVLVIFGLAAAIKSAIALERASRAEIAG